MNVNFNGRLIVVAVMLLFVFSTVYSASYYNIGNTNTTNIFVSPSGSPSNSGLDRLNPVDLDTAWARIGAAPTRGWKVQMLPGTYSYVPYLSFPGYVDGTLWNRSGPTAARPIIFTAADGEGTVTISGATFNTAGVNYLYLINLTISDPGGDTVHFTYGNHLLLRNLTLIGNRVSAEETLKVNQAQYVYVEDSDISGGYNNALDFVSVQHGSVVGNKLHEADDWCAYAKGGSAYIVFSNNEVYNCGTGGISAGQGAGFEFMTSPWLQYEAYDVKIYNNVVHDTDGAGLGVNGGYNILLAYNTLYHIGGRSHAIEVVYGSRSCDGLTAVCSANLRAGGWGTASTSNSADIPDQNVFIYNNIVYNPAGYQSQWQHFQFANPTPALAGSNVPSPVTMDTNLRIRGNLIWNGPSSLPIGIEDSSVCVNSNPTCNMAQLLRDNSFNRVEPQLVDPQHGDFRPVLGGNVFNATTYALPSFTWNISSVPRGTLSNSVTDDYFQTKRNTTRVVGAIYVGANATVLPPSCTLACTLPALLNSTSCSCYTPVVVPPINNSNSTTTPPTNSTTNSTTTTPPVTPPSSAFSLPVSTKCADTSIRNISVNSVAAIRDAINTAQPGDVIKIAPGSYAFGTQMWIEAHGTAANPICIVADGPRGSVSITVPTDEGFNVGGNSSYIVFEDLELSNTGNNVFHVQDGANHIVLRNLNLHDAGYDGDVVKINQAHNITIEGCDIARPGPRAPGGENPYQEGIDLVDSSDSVIQYNYVHDFGNMGAYTKGSSRNTIVRYNVIDNQRAGAVDPAFGIGGATDLVLLNGAQYEAFNILFAHNLVSRTSYGAVGVYDTSNGTMFDNMLYNNNGLLVEARAGNGPAGGTNGLSIISNNFVDRNGSMQQVYSLSSHTLSGVVAANNLYYNNGNSIPNGSDFGFTPGSESGAVVSDVNYTFTAPTDYLSAMGLLSWSRYSAPVLNNSGNSTVPSTNTTGNGTTTPPACTLTCTLPALLNSTSCSCYTPVVTPPTNTSSGNLTYSNAPIVPTINAAMKANLRSILANGATLGNRPSVFAKVGDSITESGSYLVDIGCGGTDQFGSYASLVPTANYFMSTSLGSAPVWCGIGNSFTRASMTAVTGWLSSYALSTTTACPAPNNTPLQCELQTIKPAYAFIMYGTNDLDHYSSAADLTAFRNNLNTIIDDSIAAGTIPVLSTIPPRLDNPTAGGRVAMYNQVIVDVATNRNIPLWNYWRTSTISGMVTQGISPDGIHPNVLNGADGAILTPAGLTYGYNQRNLQTLQILEKLKRIVADNGAPDP